MSDIYLETGAQIAGYRIESLLGRGGMSVVYLAEQLRLGRWAALKVLAPELSRQEGYRERFIRESRIAGSLDHPSVIPIYDAGESGDVLYIAMRYVEGSDLGALLKSGGPLSLGQAIFLVEHLASALDAAHARGLIHRDVKPANVLIEKASERVFLTDFGVAKQTMGDGLTKTGSFLGSVDFAAPEQLEGRVVDAAADVYALGGVLYACLTGLPPFDRTSEIAVAQAHMTEPPPRVTSERPALPLALDAVVERAMAKSADQRYASCGELAAAARAASIAPATHSGLAAADAPGAGAPTRLAAESPPPATAVAANGGQRAQRPRGRGSAVVIAVIAALIAALGAGLGVYFATRSDDGGASAGKAMNETTVTVTSNAASSSTSTPASRLAAYIAGWPAWKCEMAMHPPAGAAASENCTTKAGPDQLQVSVFHKMKTAMAAYDKEVSASPLASRMDAGKCYQAQWSGEIKWLHSAGGDVGGRVLCYVKGGAAHVVWTLEGNPPALFVASRQDENHLPLYHWWVTMRHVTFSGESMGHMSG